jgi:TrpR-related protein YerC/YecD
MNWNNSENKRLIQAILILKTSKEVELFLRDLLTTQEIDEISKRLKAAEMLAAGISYLKIETDTGLSSTTVARVAKWLNGKGGGYRAIISKLHHHDSIQFRRGLS